MTSNTKTLTSAEYHRLVSKGKSGWRCYFIMRDNYSDLSEYVFNLQDRNQNLREQLRRGEDVDMNYLKLQFIEMYDKFKEFTECPACYSLLTKDNIEVQYCGHTIRRACMEKLKSQKELKCPVCRKKY